MSLIDELRLALPIAAVEFDASPSHTGLVLVDLVNGFATVGAGHLAPPEPNEQVIRMVAECERLARLFAGRNQPIAAFLDTHVPGKPEPPYPPHCEAGTGEENLVPSLAWLDMHPAAALIRKDCINGFVGASDLKSGRNRIVDWVNEHRLRAVLVAGICTDICVMDFVLAFLSARNHGMMPSLKDVVVDTEGCATYDLSPQAAKALNLPATSCHPQPIAHHAGLYFMASRGAVLASRVV
jgi:nicotinamidase-related amidase